MAENLSAREKSIWQQPERFMSFAAAIDILKRRGYKIGFDVDGISIFQKTAKGEVLLLNGPREKIQRDILRLAHLEKEKELTEGQHTPVVPQKEAA